MSMVWQIDLPDSLKIVMLALADCANDEGHCWPSMATLAKKCSKGERTVQGVIKQLVEAGHLTRTEILGKGCKYIVHPQPPPQRLRPADTAPPQGTAQTPAAAADKPSRTIKHIGVKRERAEIVIPDWLPTEPWEGFLAMRKGKGAVPSERALILLIAKLERLRADGNDPGEVLDQSTLNNWTGIFEVKANGQHTKQPAFSPPANGRGTRPDPCLDMLLAARQAQNIGSDFGGDQPAWPALPAIGTG